MEEPKAVSVCFMSIWQCKWFIAVVWRRSWRTAMLLQTLDVHVRTEEDGKTPLLLRFGRSHRGVGCPVLVGVERLGGKRSAHIWLHDWWCEVVKDLQASTLFCLVDKWQTALWWYQDCHSWRANNGNKWMQLTTDDGRVVFSILTTAPFLKMRTG